MLKRGKCVVDIGITFADPGDIAGWIELVDIVKDHFPGLNKEDYRKTLIECIKNQEALCAKEHGKIIGILLFSIEHSMLAFMAVHPEHRNRGIATGMIKTMISIFPKGKDIWVTTFREGDSKGESARILYLRCGFVPDELVIEMNYPCQKFVLYRGGDSPKDSPHSLPGGEHAHNAQRAYH